MDTSGASDAMMPEIRKFLSFKILLLLNLFLFDKKLYNIIFYVI